LQDLDFSATIKKYQNIQPVLVLVVVVILVSGKMSCKTHLPPTKYQNIQPVFQPVFVFFDFVVMLVSAKISGKIFDTRVQKHISKAKGIIPKQKKL
jgi:hypothetical protein